MEQAENQQTRRSQFSAWQAGPIILAFFLLTMALYWRVGHFEFINFDDPKYIDPPSRVREGITLSSLWWAATTFHFNWHPLTWISLMLDFSLFGGSPGAIHLHNAVLHAINGALLYLVLQRLTRQTWPAVIAAALFAMHPLRVEPVAWVSARKDVLSSTFWLLTMLAYTAYVHRRNSGRQSLRFYLLTLIAMVMGLMAKGMLVSLPLALLILDFWPLKRCDLRALLAFERPARRQFARLVIEKVPLLIIAAAGSWVTFIAQSVAGAVSGKELALQDRLGNAVISYVEYLRMTVAPYGLAFFYPHPAMTPDVGISGWKVTGSIAILLPISLFVVTTSRRWPWLAAGWMWYVITLLPVIGIVQIGAQALADRYTYIPSFGLCMAAAWSIEAMSPPARRIGRTIAIALVPVLMVLSWRQLGFWRDSETVTVRALNVTDNNLVAHSKLAEVFDARGETGKAIDEYTAVLKINRDDGVALSYLAGRAAAENDTARAIQLFEHSIRSRPTSALVLNNYGNFLGQIGRFDDAEKMLHAAIALDPEMPGAYHNLALVLARQGKIREAIPLWQRALELNPDHVEAHFGLAQALLLVGRDREAIAEFKAALSVSPDRADILANLAWVLATDSMKEFQSGPEALGFAQRACELTHNTDALSLDSLAASQARSGQFRLAIQNAHLAADMAAQQNLTQLSQQIARRISLYEKGEPYTSGN